MKAAKRREVWLRGNVRPVAGLAVIAAVVGIAVVAGLAAVGRGFPPALVAGVAGAGAVLFAALAVVGRAAAAARLARAGGELEIRLAPGRVERVPLDVVECLFRGSELLPDPEGDDAVARRRVGTLVVRFAERADEWKSRPTFRPWGSWDDGHAVIDGRWCEPLSRETVQRIAAALVEAKREISAGGAP